MTRAEIEELVQQQADEHSKQVDDRIRHLETLLDEKLARMTQVLDERGRTIAAFKDTIEAYRWFITTGVSVLSVVLAVVGFLGVKQIFDFNERIAAIEKVKAEADEASRRLSQTNDGLLAYHTTKMAQDYDEIMLNLSGQLPKTEVDKLRSKVESNQDLIASLKQALQHRQENPAPAAPKKLPVTPPALSDEQNLLATLEDAYQAAESVLVITDPRQQVVSPGVLNTTEDKWKKLLKPSENKNSIYQKYLPHITAYAHNSIGLVYAKRYRAFGHLREHAEKALQSFRDAQKEYPHLSRAMTNEALMVRSLYQADMADEKKLPAMKDKLLEQMDKAIDLTKRAASFATQDRTASLIENNHATYALDKAMLLFRLGDEGGAAAARDEAETYVTKALDHETPFPFASITYAEIKCGSVHIDKMQDADEQKKKEMWDAIIMLVKVAIKKGLPHAANAKGFIKENPAMVYLAVLKEKEWETELDKILNDKLLTE